MTQAEPIVCRPTSWFLFRALIMLVMLSVFAGWFYRDATVGYRQKNLAFYLHQTFVQAAGQFKELKPTPTQWHDFAATQTVQPPASYPLPAGMQSVPWPEILQDWQRMKSLDWNQLWREYSKQHGYDVQPPEEAYDWNKINGQWRAFWACSILAAATAFVLIRTWRGSLRADDDALTTAQGRRIPYAELTRLDLRKWETKGLAFLHYDGPTGKGKVRIDGLTYGGFKEENGQPAERLMQRIRAHFAGELIEYAPLATAASRLRDEAESP